MRQEQNTKLTINHLVGRIMALTLKRYPQVNGLISGGKIYLRKHVDIFYQVSMEGAETELVGVCVKDADQKGILEFAQNMTEQAEAVRKSADHPMRKSQRPFHYLPWRAVRFLVKFLCWLQYDWNLNLDWLGIPKDALGSIMITSIGTLGFELAFVPLTHLGRNPMQIAVGKVAPKPVVVDNNVVIRQRMNLCCTFDHRFADGLLGSKMAKLIRELFEHIDRHRDLIEGKVTLENYTITYEK
jgi:pyruvate dehydrogenase E2 component (dihydrolipoamide acetyltransferase)